MFEQVQFAKAGHYRAVVSNPLGNAVSREAALTPIEMAPILLTEPTNLTVYLGGTARFNVAAGGSKPLSYQWQFNGNNIAGTTNDSLLIDPVLLGDAGDYSVIVQNPIGPTPSRAARMVVLPLASWGYNSPLPPVIPKDLTNIACITSGSGFCVAIRETGTVTVWGHDIWGLDFESSFPQPPGLSNVVAIAAGADHILAVRDNGKVIG